MRTATRWPPGPIGSWPLPLAMMMPRVCRAASPAWVTVADRAVYPIHPGFITVTVDPGHGGSADGAVGADGTREADVNLDIGLRLARMLQGAGVNVVLTRSRDVDVNTPPVDRTGDGLVDDTDELAARPDLANLARADLFIAVHNNIAVDDSVGGPSTFYFDERSFGDRSRRLAQLIQDEMVAPWRGRPRATGGPSTTARSSIPTTCCATTTRRACSVRPRCPACSARASSCRTRVSCGSCKQRAGPPGHGRRLLRGHRPVSRGSWHAGRLSAHEAPPGAAMAGEPVALHLEVRNQGSEPLRGWDLVVGALPADSPSVWRARGGTIVGRRRLPALAPGDSASLDVPLTAPSPGGRWTLMVDAEDADGRRASAAGSPMLLVPMSTLDALPPPVCCFIPPDPPAT